MFNLMQNPECELIFFDTLHGNFFDCIGRRTICPTQGSDWLYAHHLLQGLSSEAIYEGDTTKSNSHRFAMHQTTSHFS